MHTYIFNFPLDFKLNSLYAIKLVQNMMVIFVMTGKTADM